MRKGKKYYVVVAVHCYKIYCYSVSVTFGIFSRELPLPADGDDQVLQCRLEADCEKSELGHSVFKICQELDNDTSLTKIIPDKGKQIEVFGIALFKRRESMCEYKFKTELLLLM